MNDGAPTLLHAFWLAVALGLSLGLLAASLFLTVATLKWHLLTLLAL